jgi:hypothetical protein
MNVFIDFAVFTFESTSLVAHNRASLFSCMVFMFTLTMSIDQKLMCPIVIIPLF